jgi:hypothetical protein
VGRGVPEGVRLRLCVVLGSVDIGGKEGENTEAGLFIFDGSRCTFLYIKIGPTGLCIGYLPRN